MNYEKLYNSLIESKKKLNRKKKSGVYYESHHILPKSLGGSNDKDNLVLLTAKEHFVAHLLLWKYTKTREMCYAIYLMSHHINKGKVSAATYSILKEQFSTHMSERESYKRTPEIAAKCLKTKKTNGTLNVHTPESILLAKQTKIKNKSCMSVSEELKKRHLDIRALNDTLNNVTPMSIAKGLETRKRNGTMNTSTIESIKKRMQTRKIRGNLNTTTPESLKKAVATRMANGSYKQNPESIAKGLETRKHRIKWSEKINYFGDIVKAKQIKEDNNISYQELTDIFWLFKI